MPRNGYGTATVQQSGSPGRYSLTDALGCEHVTVEAYHLDADRTVSLQTELESVCVPLADVDAVTLADERTMSHRTVGFVPAGVPASLLAGSGGSVVVVNARAASSGDEAATPTVVDLDECDFQVPSTSDIPTARLTSKLGCKEMKVNARRLAPGAVVPYHTEGTQEELFVPVDGPGSMRIADDHVETPPGTVVLVAPQTPRSALNTGDDDSLWVMFGAPPTGGPEEWDPGAEILE